MRVVQFSEFAGPQALRLEEADEPVPGPGEVAIRVSAVGLNFFDTLVLRNKYQVTPPLPYSPGAEVSGTIEKLGAGVTGLSVGERVAAFIGGNGCREKVVTSNCRELSQEELNYIDGNPIFELHDLEYIHNIRVISAHDNFVAINSVLYVDLFGQITSESWGATMLGGAGGLPAFTIGAMMSRGGRSIMVMPSTRNEGRISSIQPTFPPGTQVTISRTFTDYIVTEYGIAGLLGKSQRQRAEELINVAHPDHQDYLREQARELFWP